jgi:hypothetical protein
MVCALATIWKWRSPAPKPRWDFANKAHRLSPKNSIGCYRRETLPLKLWRKAAVQPIRSSELGY